MSLVLPHTTIQLLENVAQLQEQEQEQEQPPPHPAADPAINNDFAVRSIDISDVAAAAAIETTTTTMLASGMNIDLLPLAITQFIASTQARIAQRLLLQEEQEKIQKQHQQLSPTPTPASQKHHTRRRSIATKNKRAMTSKKS